MDILDTIIFKVDLSGGSMLKELKKDETFFQENFILVKNMREESEPTHCCRFSRLKVDCVCRKTLYRIKPNAIELLQSCSEFYEMICYSRLPISELNQIVFLLRNLWKQKFKTNVLKLKLKESLFQIILYK